MQNRETAGVTKERGSTPTYREVLCIGRLCAAGQK
jgi:hypothetical protein